jgi:rhodanese-related sulfurtransferase
MLRALLSSCLALVTVVAAAADNPPFKVLHVADLVTLMKGGSAVTLYDVNGASTRAHEGVIPGSHLLSSSSKFSAAKELPAEKSAPLVFYCANTQCTASHDAAKKAIKEGYRDVSVMVDGIYGWKKAGEPTEPVSKSPREVAPKAAAELTKLNSALIVDVREDEERHEVVPGAQSMPTSKMDDAKAWSEFKAKLPKDKLIVLHCAQGGRAHRVADRLAAEGFKTEFFKGPDQWHEAGLPLEKGPAQ